MNKIFHAMSLRESAVSESVEKKLGIEEHIKNLYKFPVGSFEYWEVREAISDRLKEEGGKYNETLIAIPTRMNTDHSLTASLNKFDQFNKINGIVETNYEDMTSRFLFSNNYSFLEESDFIFYPRHKLEYNPQFKQLVIGSYITDGNYIVLLHTVKGQTRIEEKYTLIQGHVKFSPEAYIMPQTEFLRLNALSEFNEEIILKSEITFPETPKFYISTKNTHIGLEHFGIIYEIKVKSVEEIMQRIKSGEEEKHDIIAFQMRDMDAHADKIDDWASLVIKKLIS